MIEQFRNRRELWSKWTLKLEVVQPAPVVLAFNRKASILKSSIEIDHAVPRIRDGYAGAEEVRCENHSSIREPKLSVLERVAVRLALFILITSGEVNSMPSGKRLVIFKVTKALAEFTGPCIQTSAL